MNPQVLNAYARASERLAALLPGWFGGVSVHRGPVSVPVFPHYDDRDPRLGVFEAEVDMLVATNRLATGTIAFVPVALYDKGDILASVALSGTLAQDLRAEVREVLVLRERLPDEEWVCLGAHVLPSGRFPTLKLKPLLEKVL